MYVAIDFGISNTDLAISDQGKIVFHTTPSQSSEINADTLKNILKKHEIDISNVKKIGVTGGKSSDLDDALDGVKIAKINEIDAIGLGAKKLYGIVGQPLHTTHGGMGLFSRNPQRCPGHNQGRETYRSRVIRQNSY